jgi:hypothetical protein
MNDDALLASGDHARLLAKYEPVIVQRCVARLPAEYSGRRTGVEMYEVAIDQSFGG